MQIHLNPFCLNYHPSLYQVEVAKNGLLIPIRFFIVFGSFAFNYWLMAQSNFLLELSGQLSHPTVQEKPTLPELLYLKILCFFSIMEIIPVPISRILGVVWFVGVFCIVCNILCVYFLYYWIISLCSWLANPELKNIRDIITIDYFCHIY